MKRVFLFLATNFAIMFTLMITFNILVALGLVPRGEYGSLLVLSLVFGFGGAFISLFMSKWMAKKAYKIYILNGNEDEFASWYVSTVQRMANEVGIKTPEIGIYEGGANAFATGATKNSSLVAISTGLVNSMSRDEIEAVIGHEMSHVANGDMVTLTLVQGVVNTFVIFFSRIIGSFVDRVIFKNEKGDGIGYFIGSIFAEIILTLLGSIVVMWFSRYREFRADEGGAYLSSNQKMIAALQKLKMMQTQPLEGEMSAFGIEGKEEKGSVLADLFSTHPSLDKRIAHLQSIR
jgi:heat shock protein HtpX